MDLITNLDLRAPLIWVNSDESYRVTDVVADHATTQQRNTYRMDALLGLVAHPYTVDEWKRVLVPNPETGEPGPCYMLGLAASWVMENDPGAVFVVDFAHLVAAKDMLPFFHEVAFRYMNAVRIDDNDALPLQFVLIAAVDKVPPELTRNMVRCELPLPTLEELSAIYGHVAQGADVFDVNEIPKITRAGQGLSELEFTRACLDSIHDTGDIDAERINRIKVDTIKSSGILEVRRPAIRLDQIGGLDLAKDIAERIAWTWAHPEETKQWGVVPARKILLVGVPGSGKSAWCEAMADALSQDLAQFGVSKALSKWVGESEQNMRAAFRQVAAMAPITAWIDEFGRDMSGSGVANDSGTTDRVHGEFLQGLQELPENVTLVCAANRIDGLPPEMLRADRFDIIMFVGFPTYEERVAIFNIHLGESAKEHDIERLAHATPMFTGAEIKALIASTRFEVTPVKQRPIETEDLLVAAPRLKGRVWNNHRGAILDMYKRAKSDWQWASSGQEAEAENIIRGEGTAGTTKLAPARPMVSTGNPFG